MTGLPAGVVNMVFGLGHKVGEAIVTHPDIPLITFTGSTVTGQRIQRSSAEYCKKLSLEVGELSLYLSVVIASRMYQCTTDQLRRCCNIA